MIDKKEGCITWNSYFEWQVSCLTVRHYQDN